MFLFESVAHLPFAYPARRLAGAQRRSPWRNAAVWLGVGPQISCLAIPHLRALLGLVTLDLAKLGFVAIVVAATWRPASSRIAWCPGATTMRTPDDTVRNPPARESCAMMKVEPMAAGFQPR